MNTLLVLINVLLGLFVNLSAAYPQQVKDLQDNHERDEEEKTPTDGKKR